MKKQSSVMTTLGVIISTSISWNAYEIYISLILADDICYAVAAAEQIQSFVQLSQK